VSFTYKTRDAWIKRGTELFGDDILKWKFKCPACGLVKSPIDFKKFQSKGATPDSATKNCIGRFTGGKKRST